MEECDVVRANSSMFPVEKKLDIPRDEQPLAHTGSLQVYIQLAESVIFLQGYNSDQWNEAPPSLLRGSLIVRVLKPTKLKAINLTFRGVGKTSWPEGIPPKHHEFFEEEEFLVHTWPFFQAEDNATNSGETESDLLLSRSNASVYRPLPETPSSGHILMGGRSRSSQRMQTVDELCKRPPMERRSSSLMARSLSFGKLSKKNSSLDVRVGSATSIFSDFISATMSNGSETSLLSRNSHGNSENFVFQPGDYVYSFEHPIIASTPETIHAAYGSVSYTLEVTIERCGAFKHNLHAKVPITLVRTLSSSSVEDTEPIAISRNWENHLHYDIVIASKDIVLDAFLPITLRLMPLDKITLHRIRIYLTETIEYFCRGGKVHRVEPSRIYLLAEHRAPPLEGVAPEAISKARNLGNLLENENGEVVNKDFDYQVFIPERLNYKERLHPDVTYTNIKVNHWLKVGLRLSRIVDDSRKHFEINIDAPIHVLHKLCSHANTLLPSYDSQVTRSSDSCDMANSSALYHSSNVYFPREVVQLPMMSEEDLTADKFNLSPKTLNPLQHNKSRQHMMYHRAALADDINTTGVLNTPELRANIYQPDRLHPELVSPQAIPLSPISSPTLHNSDAEEEDDSPPPFGEDDIDRNDSLDAVPPAPPSYDEVLEEDGIVVVSSNFNRASRGVSSRPRGTSRTAAAVASRSNSPNTDFRMRSSSPFRPGSSALGNRRSTSLDARMTATYKNESFNTLNPVRSTNEDMVSCETNGTRRIPEDNELANDQDTIS
ncbi:HBR431Wp [Eremothecium sinecaudum]|uniref:HBR431Wp n=1 Tax=Eremothecium sinecaudum TaxID=45286 RepID=A0A109UXW6_9SACH|nr:HBR431Wp [Eremothecium sinecaudum]AMD19332.1 HBR431Wp [Eremothecium sinecaudum]